MSTSRTNRRLAALIGVVAAGTAASVAPAAAAENVVGIGNAAIGNTMTTANKELTAVGQTSQTGGVLSNLGQLPVQHSRNQAGGGVIA